MSRIKSKRKTAPERLAEAFSKRHRIIVRSAPRYRKALLRLDPTVAKAALKAIGTAEGAVSWLTQEAFGLAGRIPLEVAKTPKGAKEVALLLHRIDFGIAC